MPLPTQEAEIRRRTVQSQPEQAVFKTLSQRNHHKKGLVEWLKVHALSSSSSTAINKLIFLKSSSITVLLF
jgi:hypothetical protein